jgi:ABC-type lipoprotein export system ATPase subunit
MVTHDPHLASKADRMLLIKEGKVVASNVDTAWEDK